MPTPGKTTGAAGATQSAKEDNGSVSQDVKEPVLQNDGSAEKSLNAFLWMLLKSMVLPLTADAAVPSL